VDVIGEMIWMRCRNTWKFCDVDHKLDFRTRITILLQLRLIGDLSRVNSMKIAVVQESEMSFLVT
jgi:hypothetical protein